MKNKKGEAAVQLLVVGVILIVIAALVWGKLSWDGFNIGDGDSGPAYVCPDDGQTAVTLSLLNGKNSTAAQTFDATWYATGDESGYTTGTTSSNDAHNFNCGETYRLCFVAADGDAGDNSFVDAIVLGPGGAKTDNGCVVFTPEKDAYNLQVRGSQHGTLEFKAYDNDAAGWMCDSDASCTAWEADGVSFESTTNGTALAVGSGGELDLTIQARADSVDEEFSDYYTLILVEAPVATWNEPVVKVDGVKLSDVKGSLTVDEEKQFSAYEYIYKYTGEIDYDGIEIDFRMSALAGVDPSTDPEIDFAAAGNDLSIDGITVKTGAAQDDSSATVVYTVQDITINIS